MIPFTIVNDKTSLKISDSFTTENLQELPSLLPIIRQLLQLGMALLSICCMVLLGFADDVLGKTFQKVVF